MVGLQFHCVILYHHQLLLTVHNNHIYFSRKPTAVLDHYHILSLSIFVSSSALHLQNAVLQISHLHHHPVRRLSHNCLLRYRLRRCQPFYGSCILLGRIQRTSHQRLQHSRLPTRFPQHWRSLNHRWLERCQLRQMLQLDLQRQLYQCPRN